MTLVNREPRRDDKAPAQSALGISRRSILVNTAVSVASLASATAVAAPSIAPVSDQTAAEQLARVEHLIAQLRTRHIRDGFKLDEARAERVLRFFRMAVDLPGHEDHPDYDGDWLATLNFVRDHDQSLDWIAAGDVDGMICNLAARSAAAANVDDPVFAAIEQHKAAHEAHVRPLAEMARLERELPKERRRWHCSSVHGEKAPPADMTDAREWIENEINADATCTEECRALCDLVSTVPTTTAGATALIAYARTLDELPEMFCGEFDADGHPLYIHTGDALLESLSGWLTATSA